MLDTYLIKHNIKKSLSMVFTYRIGGFIFSSIFAITTMPPKKKPAVKKPKEKKKIIVIPPDTTLPKTGTYDYPIFIFL